MISTQHEASHY